MISIPLHTETVLDSLARPGQANMRQWQLGYSLQRQIRQDKAFQAETDG